MNPNEPPKLPAEIIMKLADEFDLQSFFAFQIDDLRRLQAYQLQDQTSQDQA